MKKLVLTVWVIAILCGMAVQAFASVSTTTQSAVVADGNGSAVLVPEAGEVGINVSITARASVNFEASIDGGTTYAAIACRRSGSTSGDVVTTYTSGLFYCHIPGAAYVRTPVIGWQTGTVTVTVRTQGDSVGNMPVTLGTTIAGEVVADDILKVEQRGYYTSITTATDTVLKSGPGWLQGCKILGGTIGTIKIWDNTAASGSVIIATFTPTSTMDLQGLNVSFSVGATVTTGSATILTCTTR